MPTPNHAAAYSIERGLSHLFGRVGKRVRVIRKRREKLKALLAAEDAREGAATGFDGLPHMPSPPLAPGWPRQVMPHDNFR